MTPIDLISDLPNNFDSKDYHSLVIGETYFMKLTHTPSIPPSRNIVRCVHSKMYEAIDVVHAPLVLVGENTEFFYNVKNEYFVAGRNVSQRNFVIFR